MLRPTVAEATIITSWMRQAGAILPRLLVIAAVAGCAATSEVPSASPPSAAAVATSSPVVMTNDTAPPQATYPSLSLSISNGTTIAVTVVVNGQVVVEVPPGSGQDPIKASMPAPPWNVETRSPSGRVLSSMTVHAGDVWVADFGNGDRGSKGDALRVDLSCGRLDLWSGPPMAGPAPGPGTPGDCL